MAVYSLTEYLTTFESIGFSSGEDVPSEKRILSKMKQKGQDGRV